jgi:ABC-2 type transport system ATP-binding protein
MFLLSLLLAASSAIEALHALCTRIIARRSCLTGAAVSAYNVWLMKSTIESAPIDETGPAVETVDLVRRFGAAVAVDRLTLRVERGQFFGFLGPNGAGKSTTIKMLTGLLAPTSGRARVLGRDVEREAFEVKRRIGVVPEDLNLFDRLTGAEMLTFTARMYGLGRSATVERTRELLALMELADAPKKLVVEYSHGMKKKLALACALIHRPEMLFLDEPFEGVDAIAARTLKDLLLRLTARGLTVFLTSHVLEIVERLCTHIAIINAGRLVVSGSLVELRRAVAARTEGAPQPTSAPLTLEDYFLQVTGGVRPDAGDVLSWLG